MLTFHISPHLYHSVVVNANNCNGFYTSTEEEHDNKVATLSAFHNDHCYQMLIVAVLASTSQN